MITIYSSRFLLFDTGDKPNRMIAFASDIGLEILSKSNQWHVDGTFMACPKIFDQFYTIQAWHMGEMHPCVYVYMKEKKNESYVKLLNNLEHQCWLRNFLINPKIVVSDFEVAVIEAFKQIFPRIISRGRFFHFNQWLKKLCA
jgi:hypothetical protein